MSARKKKMEEKTGFTPRKILYLSLAVLMFSAIVSFLLTANTSNKPAAQAVRGLFEGRGRVEDGLLEIEGVEPIEDVPEGEVRYYINKKVVFPNGYEQGDIVLQNPSACGYVLQFRFYLADGSSAEPIYTSPLLRPGQYLNGDKLGRHIPSGGYDCTYTVTAYDARNESVESGTVSGFLRLEIMS
ncbi:MAG: hypothetical protein IKW76_07470 [Clostridia bacterium]|nr:hypothetical protein [Clostridia bacterium]